MPNVPVFQRVLRAAKNRLDASTTFARRLGDVIYRGGGRALSREAHLSGTGITLCASSTSPTRHTIQQKRMPQCLKIHGVLVLKFDSP